MTTDTAAQLDLVRQQRDHAEAEVHRLREQLTSLIDLHDDGSELVLALTLAAKAVDVWQRVGHYPQLREFWPELTDALDALAKGPDAVPEQGHP